MLSNTAEYALRAMSWLALTPDRLVSAASLAEATHVPPDYLAKILQQLSQAGLIAGRRGVGGGYRLSKPPEEVFLLDVLQVIGPLERLDCCPLNIEAHGRRLCPLHEKIDEAVTAVRNVFGSVTFADLLNVPGSNAPLCDGGSSTELTRRGKAKMKAAASPKAK
ncbi:MAG: Rrf2 family transcriptional regulator [Phycisphaerales bacterium]|nr:Rrf2 family transcriptional regulator [Phycisphaerales bacterium]